MSRLWQHFAGRFAIDKLKSVQNAAARVVFAARRRDHITTAAPTSLHAVVSY